MSREPNPAVQLTNEDLAQIVCDGNVEGELQDRVASAIRTDPRFERQFEELEAMASEIDAEDLWDALVRNEEFDRLLAAKSFDDPAEVLNPEGSDLYEVSYRKLLAVAEARIARGEDPAPIQALKERLLIAEDKLATDAVFKVAEALKDLTVDTAENVMAEVRRDYLGKGQEDGE